MVLMGVLEITCQQRVALFLESDQQTEVAPCVKAATDAPALGLAVVMPSQSPLPVGTE